MKLFSKKLGISVFIRAAVLLVCLACVASPVRADVAPPQLPPGSSVVPGGETTQVQMMSENVLIDIQPKPYGKPGIFGCCQLVDDWAEVTASFTMRNQGTVEEKMRVRFPLADIHGYGDGTGFGGYPELEGFKAYVNKQQVTTDRITVPNPFDSKGKPVAWATFDAAFPVGQDVIIDVSYHIRASGYGNEAFSYFYYILETGVGWKGPIGSADIAARLPYPASEQNVAPDEDNNANPQMQGSEIRWHYENFEPGQDNAGQGTAVNNIKFGVVQVPIWQEVLAARDGVKRAPTDGDAWGRLGRACKFAVIGNKGFVRTDKGGQQLFEESIQAYQKAVQLAPKTARWHAGYAELLWHASTYDGVHNNYPAIEQIVRELNTALKLAPGNQQALEILDEISGAAPEAVKHTASTYDLLILTATLPYSCPTPTFPDTPTAEFSLTPAPSTAVETAAPAPSPMPVRLTASPVSLKPAPATPLPLQKPGPSLPLCGGLLILPLLFFAGTWLLRMC